MDSWLAADIGGTKIAVAVFAGRRICSRIQIETKPEQGEKAVFERLARLLQQAADTAGIKPLALGVACPGPLSKQKGIVENAPLLGWKNFPIVQLLTERLDMPVMLENDANAAAMGEFCAGAGKGCGSLAYITVSTGVGCGLILNGRLWEGFHESAGELGHLVLIPKGNQCACGRFGCLETYASGTAITNRARAICTERGGNAADMDARRASLLARQGDKGYLQLFIDAGEALGRGIAIIQQLLDVERIVIGGSVSASLDLMRASLLRSVRAGSYWSEQPEKWLRPAALQPDSGLYGAAYLAEEYYKII